jgi:hypothetical protein
VRYELLTRRLRTGNDPPIADAGPDQIGVTAGQLALDASGSFDPDGDPITFEWNQIAGPAVSLTGRMTARTTFTAAEGQSYSFRVTVRDDRGAQGVDTVTITTQAAPEVQILRFNANPSTIRAGQSSVIEWRVLDAETVEISGIGRVDPRSGTVTVAPTQTTQYRLTARNRVSEKNETIVITVERPQVSFLACTVQPMNIISGESATIIWATQNAERVSISGGIGTVEPSGNRVVTPTSTTSYTLTASNASGEVTCNVTVQVTPGQMPRILQFTASPMSIISGQASTLLWAVENATEVSISPAIGRVDQVGTREVRPTENTTYTLTARNRFGEVTATANVAVTGPPPPAQNPTLTACAANPSTITTAGAPVTISFTVTNATTLSVAPGVGNVALTGPFTVRPNATTTYTLTASGAQGTTPATCTVLVTVQGEPPTAIIAGPQVLETINRLVTLDATPSVNPTPEPLTYIWEPLSTGAAVLDQGQRQTRIQIGGLFGDYVIRLTVRTAGGLSDSTTVTIRFVSTNVF